MAQKSSKDNLFASIGQVPSGDASGASSEALANYAQGAATEKEILVQAELEKHEQEIGDQLDLANARAEALQAAEGDGFDLQDVIDGWFLPDVKFARTEVAKRSAMNLTLDSAATFGTIPDKVVRMFVDSAETKATGEAKLVVAKVLDQATGVADEISGDGNVQAAQIEARASELIENWSKNKGILDALFHRLFNKVLNRVINYQTRLGNVGNDLAAKSALLDRVAASLRARQEMVKADLLQTCINGLALEAMIEKALNDLEELEAELKKTEGAARGPLNEIIKEQQAFVQVMIKRLVDLKGFAVKEIGLYSIIGTIRNSVAVIRADVEFTRTNLIAALGLQLGLVVDIVSALRVAKATRDVRRAEAQASEAVGTSAGVLQEAANEALLEVETTMRSLELTIGAAIRGIQNTRENMDRVQTMQRDTNARLGQLMTDMGNA